VGNFSAPNLPFLDLLASLYPGYDAVATPAEIVTSTLLRCAGRFRDVRCTPGSRTDSCLHATPIGWHSVVVATADIAEIFTFMTMVRAFGSIENGDRAHATHCSAHRLLSRPRAVNASG
jgi:hypothetical protein